MSLKNKINRWISAGLINQSQAEAILHYEKTERPRTIWGLSGFLLVAACSAGLGMIALIAANWRAIPIYAKLAGYFVLLISLGYYLLTIKLKNKSNFLSESLLIFFVILCLAGIGLISQIYNIGGEFYETLLLWSSITFLLTLLDDKELTSHIWLTSFYIGFSSWVMSAIVDTEVFLKITLQFPVFFLGLTMVLHNQKIEKTLPLNLFLPKRKALAKWAVFTGFISLISFNILSFESDSNKTIGAFDFILLSLLGGFVFTAITFSPYKKIQKNLLHGTLLLFFLFYIMALSIELNSLLSTFVSILILSLPAFFFATFKKKKLFGLFIFAIAVRLLIFYIDIYVSLMVTGLILIALAGLIFITVQLVKKNEKQILQWLTKLE